MKYNSASKKRDNYKLFRKILLITLIVLFILSLLIIFDPANIFKVSEGKVYKIKNGGTNKYLEVADDSTVDLKGKEDNLDQAFTIEDPDDGKYKVIKNVNTMKALEINVAKDTDSIDAILIEDSYKKQPEQKFDLIKQAEGYYLIKNKKTDKYLTVKDDEVIEKELSDPVEKSQKWYLEEISSPYKSAKEYMKYKYVSEGDHDRNRILEGAKVLGLGMDDKELNKILDEVVEDTMPKSDKIYRIRSGYSNLYWKIDRYSLANEYNLLLDYNGKTLNQSFRIVPSGESGYYNIVSLNSNKNLDCYGKSTKDNERIIQYNKTNTDNQKFKFKLEQNGIYKIQLKHSGKYLTIKSDSKSVNAQVVQWPYKTSGANNQDWYLEEVGSIGDVSNYVKYCVEGAKIITTDRVYTSCLAAGLSVNKDDISSKIDNSISSAGNEVFTDKTAFITTYNMLDKTVDQISFAGAHNAFSNNKDRRSSYVWDTYQTGHDTGTENHDISIGSMLNLGYRVIDLDIGNNGNGHTGSYHRYRLRGYSNQNGNNAIQPKIKKYLDENPSEIVIIHMSDVYNGTIDLTKLRNNSLYHKGEENYNKMMRNFTNDMKDTGLLAMCYNFSGDMSGDLYSKMKIPGQQIAWPTLKQMIKSNKRVLFLERDTHISVDVPFKNLNSDPNNAKKENLNLHSSFLSGLKGDNKNKIVNITFTEDWGASAGDKNAAKINNNGTRIFDINSKVDDVFKENDINKVVNVVYVDYATGNNKQGGWEVVSPVDAVNKENFKHYGMTWSKDTVGRWYW